ncbi:MAG: aldo/keto reductase [Armatimonadetes bacterium]|nr:aldo/keto reductase [Armatimonadota bacterium]
MPGGLGASERELAACLRRLGSLDRCVICTKGGHPGGGEMYSRPDGYMDPDIVAADIQDSLERLDVGTIDLYLLHRDDPRLPVAEILDCLFAEVDAGRLRWLGASNWPVARLAEARAYAERRGRPGFVVSEVQWSLPEPIWQVGPDPTTRTVAPDELGWHTRTGLPVMAYTATAGGYLSKPDSPPTPMDTPVNLARRQRARELAARRGCTPVQVGLAWLMHQPFPAVPIFSTVSLEHLTEAIGANDVPLTAEELRWLATGEA